jgi:hypothetical protein
METTTDRRASTPTWGAIRDGVIAVATTSLGAWVLSKTGSPELAQAAQEFAGGLGNLALGLAVGAGIFLRKVVSEKIAASAK